MAAADAHRVLLGRKSPAILGIGCLVHLLTIVIVWSLAQAQGLPLPVADAAVLFTVMIGVTIVPISVSGWGLRELAVVSLLGNLGVAPERALLFSVCFGFAIAVGSLPGAVVWLFCAAVAPGGPARRMKRPASGAIAAMTGQKYALVPGEGGGWPALAFDQR
jgi:glycosyltransferase 2 family protein